MYVISVLVLCVVCASNAAETLPKQHIHANDIEVHSEEAKERQKRFIFFTSERRLSFPPGAAFIITPTLALPFIRNLPTGYLSNMTISMPFKVDLGLLGLTSNENPWFILPNLFSKKRSAENDARSLVGGDRRVLFQVIEDSLYNVGMDGKACLLRAICEMHEYPLFGFGLVGEILELLLTVSKSPGADKDLADYSAAERAGKHDGECWRYYKECPKSLFKWKERNKYTAPLEDKMDSTVNINMNTI